MRKLLPVLMLVACTAFSGCSWLTGANDDVEPEKLYSDTPCQTECCCKTKRGYYSYFACQDRVACEGAGGDCQRPDTARCQQ